MKSRVGPTTSYIVKKNFLVNGWTFSSLLILSYPQKRKLKIKKKNWKTDTVNQIWGYLQNADLTCLPKIDFPLGFLVVSSLHFTTIFIFY